MADNKPAYRVFRVIKRKPKPDGTPNDFWLNLGVAYAHSGDGFNLLLQAMPAPELDSESGQLQYKLVMRPFKEHEEEEAPKGKPHYKK